MTTSDTEEDVRGRALDAAQATFDRALKLVSPPRHTIAEAFDAAVAVYDQAEKVEVDRLMDQTGFAGLEITGNGVQLRLKYAADIAAHMVEAFDTLCEVRGATNYVEWESTITDPAREQAIKAGLPQEEWPPHRRYSVIVVKPGGKTPHQLRQEAEQALLNVTGTGARDRLARHMWENTDGPAGDADVIPLHYFDQADEAIAALVGKD